MPTVSVERVLAAPLADLFDWLSYTFGKVLDAADAALASRSSGRGSAAS